jgi:hypothetical protein
MKNETTLFAGKRMKQDAMLSEVSHCQKDKYCMFSHVEPMGENKQT